MARMRLHFDSQETQPVRDLAVALHKVGLTGQLQVGVNGPEHWAGETPNMSPHKFVKVMADILHVTADYAGERMTVAEALEQLKAMRKERAAIVAELTSKLDSLFNAINAGHVTEAENIRGDLLVIRDLVNGWES